MNRLSVLSLVALLGFSAVGCGSDDSSSDKDAATGGSASGGGSSTGGLGGEGTSGGDLEVEGSWTGDFGDETISAEAWNGTAIIEFDNDENRAITQNADDAEYGPSQFNVIVWTEPADGSFAYCTVDYGLETLDAAHASTKTADANDLEAGCDGFPWSTLSEK